MTDLRSMMAADAADGGVFFPRDSGGQSSGFNEDVTFYPEWDEGRKVTVNVVIVRDGEEGTRESRGDGVVLNHPHGKSTRRSIDIEVPAALNVRDSQPSATPDGFKINGELWSVKRIIGRDDDLMTVRCIRRRDETIRNESRVG